MPLSVWLAAVAIAAALPLAWWSLSGATSAGSARSARANLTAGLGRVTDLRRVVLDQSATDRVVAPAVATLAERVRRVTPAGMVQGLERRLHLAGMGEAWPIERILALKAVLAVVAGSFGALVLLASPSVGRFLLVALLVALAYFLPDLWVHSRAEERQAEIERTLADALDQMTVCVEAGLSFEAAVAQVAQSSGPLADELGRTLQDFQIGIPRARALENLLARTDVADLRTFVHAFAHAERYGIPIAQVLRVQSGELREKRRQRAEERAQKIPVKLVFPVVLCILPALFIVLAGPAVIRVSEAF